MYYITLVQKSDYKSGRWTVLTSEQMIGVGAESSQKVSKRSLPLLLPSLIKHPLGELVDVVLVLRIDGHFHIHVVVRIWTYKSRVVRTTQRVLKTTRWLGLNKQHNNK